MSDKKLSKLKFVGGMEYLNAFYIHFKLDIENEMVQRIWYNALRNIDDTSFELLVTDYCEKNTFPPSSPHTLTEWFDKMVELMLDDLSKRVMMLETSNRLMKELPNGYQTYYIDYEGIIESEYDTTLISILKARKNGEIKYLKIEDLKRYLFDKNDKTLVIENNDKLLLGELNESK